MDYTIHLVDDMPGWVSFHPAAVHHHLVQETNIERVTLTEPWRPEKTARSPWGNLGAFFFYPLQSGKG